MIDPRLIEACIRIRNVPELSAFKVHIEKRLEEEMNLLSTIGDDRHFRLGQGKTQAFKELLTLLDDAPALLEKFRSNK